MSAGAETRTSEQAWTACATLQGARLVEAGDLLRAASRLVVVSPHPDDETLAAGGLMVEALARSVPVRVVSVTDGEASHAGSTRWPAARLRAEREAELDSALALLGLAPAAVTRFHVDDGGVAGAVDALIDRLRVRLRHGDLVVGPWRGDGHPDHEAVADALLHARPRVGFRLLEAPIWMWHWQTPDATAIPWPGLVRMPLSRAATRRKARALSAFRSELERDPSLAESPIVDAKMLAHFQRPYESFFVDVA